MRIASWNVNGIRAVATKGFAESLKMIDADIIGLQEIKALKEQQTSKRVFKVFVKNRNLNERR